MQKDYKPKRRQKRWKMRDFIVPGGGTHAVKVPDNSPMAIEKALRQLKRQLKDSDLFQEIRDRRYFKKPSLEKREKMQAAKRWNAKEVREQKRRDKMQQCWTILTTNGPK